MLFETLAFPGIQVRVAKFPQYVKTKKLNTKWKTCKITENIVFETQKNDKRNRLSKKIIIFRICDMIKGNESDVGNIDFELQA